MGGWKLIHSVGLSLIWLAGASGCASEGSLGPPAGNNAGAAGTPMDWSHPLYFAKASDPVYTIHQTGWANPDVEGRHIHIPVRAKPAGGDDASFSVVDTDGWEYDFWQAQAPSGNGGTFTANFAKRAPWDGNGLGTSGTPYQGGITAAGFSNQATRAFAISDWVTIRFGAPAPNRSATSSATG